MLCDAAPRRRIRVKEGKGNPYSITEHRVPELTGSQPASDPATLKRAATNFAAW